MKEGQTPLVERRRAHSSIMYRGWNFVPTRYNEKAAIMLCYYEEKDMTRVTGPQFLCSCYAERANLNEKKLTPENMRLILMQICKRTITRKCAAVFRRSSEVQNSNPYTYARRAGGACEREARRLDC